MSVSDGFFCDYWGNPIVRVSKRRGPTTSGNILERIVVDEGIIGAPLFTMVRRDVIARYNIKFDERLTIGEDWFFWVNLARFIKFGFFAQDTGRYRWYAGNTTNSVQRSFRNDQLLIIHKEILKEDFFDAFSVETKERLFYRLLMEILVEKIDKQRELIYTKQFQTLPLLVQSKLIRWVAIEAIIHSQNVDYAKELLTRAIKLNPTDVKARALKFIVLPSNLSFFYRVTSKEKK